MKLLKLHILFFSALILASAAVAHADKTFNLTVNGCSGTGGCGTGPYGTVKLVDTSSSVITVTVDLSESGDKFVKTGAGDALEFNILGFTTAGINVITSGFSVGPAPDTASTFGSFLFSVTCSGCGNGGSSPLAGPLVFTVTKAGITDASFTGNSPGGYFFASDIMGNGNTGNVGALDGTTNPPVVPEPSTFALLGTGLLAAAGTMRKRLVAR